MNTYNPYGQPYPPNRLQHSQVNNTVSNLIPPEPGPSIASTPNQNNNFGKIIDKGVNHKNKDIEMAELKGKKRELEMKGNNNEVTHIGPTTNIYIINNEPVEKNNGNINNDTNDTGGTDGRLEYGQCIYILFLVINIILPGIGTIIAGVAYGKNTNRGDRTGELIVHGVIQFFTFAFIFGWIWAIIEASKYFQYGSCGCF